MNEDMDKYESMYKSTLEKIKIKVEHIDNDKYVEETKKEIDYLLDRLFIMFNFVLDDRNSCLKIIQRLTEIKNEQ